MRAPDSRIATGVVAFDSAHSGYYVILATKSGYKRTAHGAYVRCDRSFVGITVVLYRGPANLTIQTGVDVPNSNVPPISTPVATPQPTYEPTTPRRNESVPEDNRATRDQDPGVDLGVVISERANLRDGPSTSSPILRELTRGAVVALINRSPIGPWYHVIHVESSIEGWINGNTIRLRYTENPKPSPVFEERYTGSNDDPEIEIINDSDKTLYLKVANDERIVVAAHGTRTISKSGGTYQFYASCPGVLPAFGERTFKVGIIYTWRFFIVTTYR